MALKKSQQSLKNWTKQKWRTKSGKKSSETGERYLPEAAIKNMSDEEYAATTRAKREGTRKGKQFVAQPKEIAKKTKKYRTMKKGGMMKGKKSQMGMVKSAAPKRKKEMSDKEYFEMQDRKRREGIASMTGQDSVNFLQKLMGGSGRFAKMASKTFDPKKASKFTQRVINETPPMGRQQLQEGGKLKKKLKKIGRVLSGKDYLLGNERVAKMANKRAKKYIDRKGGSMTANRDVLDKRAERASGRQQYRLSDKLRSEVGKIKHGKGGSKRTNYPGNIGDRDRIRKLVVNPGELVKRQKQFNIGGALLSGGLSAVGKKLIDGEKMDMKELGKTALGGAMTGAASAIPFKKGGKFKALVRKLMKEGKSKKNAQGIAAIAGRKKYGAKKFASMAAAGRRKRG